VFLFLAGLCVGIIEEDFMEGPSSDLKLRHGMGPNRKPGNSRENYKKLPFRFSNSSNVSYPIDQNGAYL